MVSGCSCLPQRKQAMSGNPGSLGIWCQAWSPIQHANGLDMPSPFIGTQDHGTRPDVKCRCCPEGAGDEGERLITQPWLSAPGVRFCRHRSWPPGDSECRVAREDDRELVMRAHLNVRRINLDVLDGRVVATTAG